jgi:hypothetical protein
VLQALLAQLSRGRAAMAWGLCPCKAKHCDRSHSAVRNRIKISKGGFDVPDIVEEQPAGDGGLCPPISFGSGNRMGTHSENFWVYGNLKENQTIK